MKKMYIITKGTKGKLLTRLMLDQYEIKEWTTRKELTFNVTDCGINPIMIQKHPELFDKQSLGYALALAGFALFTNSDGFDRLSKHILAVPFKDLQKVERDDGDDGNRQYFQ